MDPVALVAAAAFVLMVVVGALAWSARSSRQPAGRALAQAQQDVEALAARVCELSAEVDRVRREGREHEGAGREYVITTLGSAPGQPPRDTGAVALAGPSAGALLQRRLVAAIRRSTADRPAEEVLVTLAVRTVAVGHGVRRALSAENRDRIAWEMRRAARASRRSRRREVRAARREARARRLAAGRSGAPPAPAAREDAA